MRGYRAWDVANKEMLYPDGNGYFGSEHHLSFVIDGNGKPIYIDDMGTPVEIIFLQQIGLKDKNGKEIWEGDIVLKPSGASMQIDPKELGIEGNKYRVYESIPPKRYAVYGHGFAFMLGLPGKKDYCGIINYGGDRMAWELEVIGNIYENPDLLKEQS